MDFNRWWVDDPRERYWLEITDRKDLGVDLRAPQVGRNGREMWHHSLVNEVRAGDVVFHYGKQFGSSPAISSWSRAVGSVWSEPISWAPHAGHSAGAVELVPGWRIGLEGYFPLDGDPVKLEDFRSVEDSIRTIESDIVSRHRGAVYQPFETGKRKTRPQQAYLTKFPREMVRLFDSLSQVEAGVSQEASSAGAAQLGSPYRRTNESVLVSDRDPFAVDPAIVERGLRGHAQTQNELADFLLWHGIEPRSPNPGEPLYDIGFESSGSLCVVEVKRITSLNLERQLRLGLGQVLRYAHLLGRSHDRVTPALATELKPPDDWLDLAESLGVTIAWPGSWARLL